MLKQYFDALSIRRLCILCLIALVGLEARAMDAVVTISSKSITFSSGDASVKNLSVKVVNPNGEVVYSEASSGAISWSLTSGAIDGRYKYELVFSDIARGSGDRTKGGNSKAIVKSESGSITVVSGLIVVPAQVEEEASRETGLVEYLEGAALAVVEFIIPSAHADIIQNDDVIITFSQCVGNDCVNGEDFGFDTIRLKENNVRMHFDDTSNSTSFPRNDWRFIFNETTNGGANLFSIEDATAGNRIFTLDAGAPANSLYLDETGRLGLGTSTPTASLDLVTGNSPTIRLNQSPSLGFSAQTWDIFGNEQGFFLTDVTGGSIVPLSIAKGAPSDSLVVNASGNLGVGINNPTESLHVVGNAIISGNLELGSSRTIKNQIKGLGIEQAMQAFRSLEPVLFKYNHSPNKQSIGFIAEDVPDLVATESHKSLRPMDMIAVLTKVMQEQQKTIDELSETVEALLSEKK